MLPTYGVSQMYIKKVNPYTVDIFLNFDTHPTGFEPSCWLRLIKSHQKPAQWKQIAGIRLPSYKYQTVLKTLQEKGI